VSAVEPQNQREILQKSQSLAAEAKYPPQTWRADVASRAQRAIRSEIVTKPLTCSSRDCGSRGHKA
jgi:hypothetical protein